MGTNFDFSPSSSFSNDLIHKQLERILSSDGFSSAKRQQSFLRFVVSEELAGRGSQLKETLIACEVYGRAVDYDPRIDSVVRVDASKLRLKLQEFYEHEGIADAVRISMPKGSYRPLIEVSSPIKPAVPVQSSSRGRIAFFVAAGVLAAVISWSIYKPKPLDLSDASRSQLMRLTESTTFSGSVSVSKDGQFCVYSSDRNGSGALSLWRQPLQGGSPVQLTQAEFNHRMPTISADGKHVVFRMDQGGGMLAQMPASGGNPIPIPDSAGGRDPRFAPLGKAFAYWIPKDEQTVDYGRVMASEFDSQAGGVPVQLFGDFAHASRPIWSEDAKYLLALGTWQSNIEEREFDAWLVELDGLHPKGLPRKSGLFTALKQAGLHPLVTFRPQIEVADWNQDWLYVTIPTGESVDLYRVRFRPSVGSVEGPFQRITVGAGAVRGPRLAGNGSIVFARPETSYDLHSLAVPPALQSSNDLKRHTNETGQMTRPFVHRSGTMAVWENFPPGSKRKLWFVDLTTGQKRTVAEDFPHVTSHALLAPDGAAIAFRADEPGVQPIYVQPLAGGPPRRVCANCGMPSDWTSDGHHMLYVTGGKPARIGVLNLDTGEYGDRIEHPSFNLFGARSGLNASGDGWVLFYAENGARTRQILLAPMQGFTAAPQEQWISVTDGAHWDQSPALAPDGKTIYYVNRTDGHASIRARIIDPSTGKPQGQSWEVHSFKTPNHTLMASQMRRGGGDLHIANGRIYFALDTQRSNLWKINLLAPAN